MATLTADLADLAAARHGILTVASLLEAGISRAEAEGLVGRGLLVPVHQGVYRWRTQPATPESACVAACAASPGLVITGPTGGTFYGLRRMPRLQRITAIAPNPVWYGLRGVAVRRTTCLEPVDAVERDDGIRLATPRRLWFDLAAWLGDESFESVTEQILDRYCTMPELWRTLARLGKRGRKGTARARRVTSQRTAWQKPADSDLELRVLRALERRGLVLVRQFALRLPEGTMIHVDGADPRCRWGLEVDHVTWHGGRLDAQSDKARDRRARALGWQIDRVTDVELAKNFDAVITELLALHALRHAELCPRRP